MHRRALHPRCHLVRIALPGHCSLWLTVAGLGLRVEVQQRRQMRILRTVGLDPYFLGDAGEHRDQTP